MQNARDEKGREVLRKATDELIVMAELSIQRPIESDRWRDALSALRAHAEELIRDGDREGRQIAAIDVVLDRIELAEHLANEALRACIGTFAAKH